MILLLIAFLFALKSPKVQTYIGMQAASYLSGKLNAEIRIRKIDVVLYRSAEISGLYVEDQKKQKLLSAEHALANYNLSFFPFSFEMKGLMADSADIHLQKHKGEDQLNLQFIVDYFASDDTTARAVDFTIPAVELSHSRFRYDDHNKTARDTGIDFNHIDARQLYIDVNSVRIYQDTITGTVNHIAFNEKSGFELYDFSAQAEVNPEKIDLRHLSILTEESDIKMDMLMSMDEYSDFGNFIEKVEMQADMRNSSVEMKDIAYFAPALTGIRQVVNIRGGVKGTVDNLKGRNVHLNLNEGTYYTGDFELDGLPDIEETFIHLDAEDFSTSAASIERLPLPPFDEQKRLNLPVELKRLGRVHYKGKFTGFYSDFVAYGTFSTSLGNVKTDLSMKQGDRISYKGNIRTVGFDMGEMFDIKEVGSLTANLEVKGEGVTKETAGANVKGMISSIEIKKYDYKNVKVRGDMQNEKFNGFLSVKDENVDFDFNGLIDYTDELPQFHFTSELRKAKLVELKLTDQLDSSVNVSASVDIQASGNNADNIRGRLRLSNIAYSVQEDTVRVDTVKLIADRLAEQKRIRIESDVADAEIKGDYTLADLPSSVKQTLTYFVPSYSHKQSEQIAKQDFKFSIEIKDNELPEKIWLKDVELSPYTFVSGSYDSEKNDLQFNASATEFVYEDYKFQSVFVKAKTINDKFYLNIGSNLLYLTDSSTIENFNVNTELVQDTVISNINWENYNDHQYKGDINLITSIDDFEHIEVRVKDSYLVVSDTTWNFNNENKIVIDSNSLLVRNLSIKTNEQSIVVDGKLSKSDDDQIDALIKNFRLGNVNPFFPSDVLRLHGTIDGVASLSDIYGNVVFTSNLDFKDFKVNNSFIGDGELNSSWDKKKRTLNLAGEYYRGSVPTIKFAGNYYPDREVNSLDIGLELNRTDLRLAQNYIDDYVSDLRGIASGQVDISGTPDNPLMEGELTLQKFNFRVNYLNTHYSASGDVDVVIEPDMFAINNATFFAMKDGRRAGDKANVIGTVFHENYENTSIDIGIDAHNFLCLNTTATDNELYYGTAYASGYINISGYADQLVMDISVKTEENTQFNIPLGGAEEVSKYNFIQFVGAKADSAGSAYEVDLTGIRMNFDLEATPDAEVRLIFDEQVGDVMKGRGSGNLEMEITNTGDFNIYGKYTLSEGDYLFTLQNIINKKFVVQKGGTISWNGDPYMAELDLTAVYRLRTSLINIMRGTTVDSLQLQKYKRRVPVELNLHMSEQLSNPDIRFGIELPLADEETQQRLESQLYLSQGEVNRQEMNRQVFALLMLNSFLPPQNQGGPNINTGNEYAGFGATSSSEVLSNQLSNWLSNISNEFDVGFNYRPGTEVTDDEVELALSTQILNDRVILETSVGYSGNQKQSTSQNTSNIVGDFKAEYKVSEDGKFRIQAFNRSNNYSLLENRSLYTQGLGVSYQENFSTWRGFFRKMFGKIGLDNKRKKDKSAEGRE